MKLIERVLHKVCFAVVLGLSLAPSIASAQAPSPVPAFPASDKVFQDDKQFNALTLGPGNDIEIHQAPPDLQLDSFDFSSDGKLLFMIWASGRVEVRDVQTSKRIAQFKPMPDVAFEVETNDAIHAWVVTGQHGLIRFIDPQSRKEVREIQTEIGRFKYDIQKVLLAPDGRWLAYVNQDNGKVLDIGGGEAKAIADLGDAYDIALSQDGSQLWAVDRTKIYGFALPEWKQIGSALLIDQVKLDTNTSLALVAGKNGPVAFVPSKSALLRYELKTMTGAAVTQKPAYRVYSPGPGDRVIVNELGATSLYAEDGTLRCQWQLRPAQGSNGRKISENGEWFGVLNFGKVEVWNLRNLLNSCADKQ
jgi:WD40 repeat protein